MKPIILPEEKLDELAQKVSAALISGHYFHNEEIRGDEIKNFAEHQQVNKFLLFQIYQVWNIQISKLKHPYFDFSHPEVEQELTSLRNLLSQHINISKEDFEPLLKRAIYNNLKLLLDPSASFEDFFFLDKDTISLDLFSQYAPFFTDLDFIVNSILRYHQKHTITQIEKSTFFSKMEKVIMLYDEKSHNSFEDHRKDVLSKILQRNIDDVLMEVEQELRASQQQEAYIDTYEEASYESLEYETSQSSQPDNVPQHEVKYNFFETVNSDNDDSAFDFSDDIDDLDINKQIQEQPEQRPAASWESSDKPLREEYYSSDNQVSQDSSYKTDTYNDSYQKNDSFQQNDLHQQNDSYQQDSFQRDYYKQDQAKTVEEALSSFLNSDDTPPAKTNFDTYNQPQSQDVPDRQVEQPRSQPTNERSFDQQPRRPENNPYEQRSFPQQETPDRSKEQRDISESGHLNRFLQEEKEDIPTNYSRILTNHKSDRTPTVAEKIQAQQTKQNVPGGKEIRLSDIPIHRQYQFVQKVFEGNNVRFRIIVDKVNNSKNREEVENIIERFVLSNDTINKNDDAVQEFIQMLRNRH